MVHGSQSRSQALDYSLSTSGSGTAGGGNLTEAPCMRSGGEGAAPIVLFGVEDNAAGKLWHVAIPVYVTQ